MKEKNHAISLIRFVAMVFILCCHSFEWIGYTLGESNGLGTIGNYCAVGVQIFLIISGYLYGCRKDMFRMQTRLEFILNRIKKVLLVYYVYTIVVIIPVYCLLSPDSINLHSILKLVTCSGTIEGVHHLWFIPYILFAYILTPLLFDYKQYVQKKRCSVTKILSAMLGLMLFLEVFGRSYNSYFIIAWINSYLLGFFLPDIREMVNSKKQIRVTIVLFVLSMLLNCYGLHVRYELLPSLELGIKYELCNYYIN